MRSFIVTKIKTMKYLSLIFALFTLSFSATAQFGDLINKAKTVIGGEQLDISAGLKEALNLGVKEAVTSLSAKDGYYDSPYRILVPEDAQKVIDKVKLVPGFQGVEEDLIRKMNEAAELTAQKATPIFVGAIKNMTIKDGKDILMGKDDAATRYLERTTRTSLYEAFMPVIRESLDEVNARSYWKTVVDAYNKIPFTKDMNPELDDHVNNAGLDGLFRLIEKKEGGIRNDVAQRTSPLLKDVFGQQDN